MSLYATMHNISSEFGRKTRNELIDAFYSRSRQGDYIDNANAMLTDRKSALLKILNTDTSAFEMRNHTNQKPSNPKQTARW